MSASRRWYHGRSCSMVKEQLVSSISQAGWPSCLVSTSLLRTNSRSCTMLTFFRLILVESLPLKVALFCGSTLLSPAISRSSLAGLGALVRCVGIRQSAFTSAQVAASVDEGTPVLPCLLSYWCACWKCCCLPSWCAGTPLPWVALPLPRRWLLFVRRRPGVVKGVA